MVAAVKNPQEKTNKKCSIIFNGKFVSMIFVSSRDVFNGENAHLT